jgi:opacity protein-like surface antigen
MKIKSFYLPLLLLLALGQTNYGQGFKGGIQGGVNLTQVDGDRNGGYNKLGFNAGVFVNYHLEAPHLSLGMDIMYMNKGSRNNRDPQSFEPIILYNYHYLSLPFYLRYQKEKLAIRGGLSWGYVMASSFDDGGSKKEIPGLRPTDFGFLFGVEYPLNDKIAVFANYQYSIRSIIDIDKSGVNLAFPALRRNGVYHNLIQVSLKYYLSQNNG